MHIASSSSRFSSSDACISADYAVARCLSVCLSVTHQYCVKVVTHTVKHFHHRVATPLTLLFQYRILWQYSYGNLQIGMSNAGWV